MKYERPRLEDLGRISEHTFTLRLPAQDCVDCEFPGGSPTDQEPPRG